MRWPRATGLATPIAGTVWLLRSTSVALASAPPATSSTASAASAGRRSRGRAGRRSPGGRWPPRAGAVGVVGWLPGGTRSVVTLI
jgi:hypothetical protein